MRASDTSFQVRWLERTFESGAVRDTKRLTGLFSIALTPPRTVDAVRKNPLGIYVHAFNWSQDASAEQKVADELGDPARERSAKDSAHLAKLYHEIASLVRSLSSGELRVFNPATHVAIEISRREALGDRSWALSAILAHIDNAEMERICRKMSVPDLDRLMQTNAGFAADLTERDRLAGLTSEGSAEP